MTIQDVLYWAAAIIAIGGAGTVVWKITKPLVVQTKKLLHSLDKFTEDWFGTEAGPGRDAVPGVMARLNNIDGELKHNGGSTMKDAVKRIEERLTTIDGRLEEGNARFDEFDKRLTEVEKGSQS
jgi:hypothetical protein